MDRQNSFFEFLDQALKEKEILHKEKYKFSPAVIRKWVRLKHEEYLNLNQENKDDRRRV